MGQYESVRLFVERAAQVSPDFSLAEENAPAVALICQRLDGIPLAIELAASRGRVLSAEQIAARLDHTFRLLTGGSRAVLPRQQTLKATIDWSYDLLNPKERLLLQRLSVFAGGWTLEAAEAVCPDEAGLGEDGQETHPQIEIGEVLDLLTSLVDKSLVIVGVGENRTRYRMLETIRQYGRDRLLEAGGSEPSRDRHLAYCAGLTGQAEPHLRGKGQVEWLDRLQEEQDNLRAAMQWSQGKQIDLGLQIAADLMWFWWLRGFTSEGREWLKTLLSKEENSRETQSSGSESNRLLQRARALRAYVWVNLANFLFTSEEFITTIEESVSLLRKLGLPARRELAISLYYLLIFKIGMLQPSPEKEEMLEIFRQEKMRFYYSEFLFYLQGQLWDHAELSQLKAYLEESLAISREIEDLDGIASRAQGLAGVFRYEGNYQKAELLARESIELSHRVKNSWWEAVCYLSVIEIELAQGSYEEAAQHSQEVRSVYHLEVKEQGRSAVILRMLLISAWARGDFEEAVRLGRQILDFPSRNSWDKSADYYFLARVALSQDDLDQAETLIKKAILELIGDRDKAQFLEGAAVLFSLQGKYPQAVRLCGAADDLYQRIRLGLPLRERNENEEALSSAQFALGEEAFTAAWKEGQAMTLEQARACALDEMG
jgi:tetratricopeptide (TPR) repeat protein